MNYQQIVNTPIMEMNDIAYDQFVDLISACMVEILRTEGKAKEDIPFDTRHELAERYQKLNDTYHALTCHKHFATYEKHISSLQSTTLKFRSAA